MPSHPEPVEGFDTVLVANRGEIARRVIRTLRRLGIRSVAIYSDADAGAPHVREADVAVRVGPAPARVSYLDVEAVIAAAIATGADAVHPGYGFLSESVAFARACAAAGVVFVGPGERALEVMGDKIRAREHVAARGVPIVPGFSGVGLDDAGIALSAAQLGFPLLVKPSAGGGGKGMQVVVRADDLPAAVASSRRVAASAFGDDALLFERLVEAPRHIEVQVLADDDGTVVHLGERECTLQRRHQKVIEEAPSPLVDEARRRALGDAAREAAASVGYRGAGTVEFLVSARHPDDFFFIEMNTRLQVEHPVTELVTGVDLVEEQLRVAAGAPRRFGQHDVVLRGHAVEARVYAESPRRGFLPSTGEVLAWRAAAGVRTDAGIVTGSVVTADYDPMIAKVIAVAPDRATALQRLDRALADTIVLGVDTNIDFLRALVRDPRVVAGDLDTAVLETVAVPAPAVPGTDALAAAAAALPRTPARALLPWTTHSGWRSGAPATIVVTAFTIDADSPAAGGVVEVDASVTASPTALVAHDGAGVVWVHDAGVTARLTPLSRRMRTLTAVAARTAHDGGARAALVAPLPGTVVAVHATDGQHVVAGHRIATIEAMKMEHAVTAPHDGVVRLHVAVGGQIARGQVVADVDRPIEEETS